MKKTEEVKALDALLSNTKSRKTDLDEIIDKDCGVKELPYIPNIELLNWAGLMIPKKIYDICVYFKNILSEKSLYSTALDFSIYAAAVQYVMYNDMVIKLCDPECPMTSRAKPSEILGVAEALRKSLRELGITRGTCGVHGNKNLEDKNDPIADILKNMNEDDEEEEIIGRRK